MNACNALSPVTIHPRYNCPRIGIRSAVDHVNLPVDRSSVCWPVTGKTVPSGFSFFINLHHLRLKIDFLTVLCPGDDNRPCSTHPAQSNNLHMDGDGFIGPQPEVRCNAD
jgi:hypothetical protein